MDAKRLAPAAIGGILSAAAVLALLWAAPQKFWSNDAYYMLAVGRHIAESGAVPGVDVLTMHGGLSYACQQWSFCLALWGAFSALGEPGCVALFCALAFLACAAVAAAGGAGSAPRPAAWLSPYLFLPLSAWFMCGTPRALDVAAMAFGLVWAERVALAPADARPTAARLSAWAALPGFCLVFANVHGAMWPMPLFAPACALLDRRCRRRRVRLFAAIAASSLACLANPSGARTLMLPFASLLAPSFSVFVAEVQSPGPLSPVGLCCAAFAGVWLWRRRRAPETPERGLGLFDWMLLASVAASLLSMRNFLFAAAAFCIALMRSMPEGETREATGWRAPAAFALAGAAALAVFLPGASAAAVEGGAPLQAEVEAASAAVEEEFSGSGAIRAFCSPDIGSAVEYLAATGGCRIEPFIDTRAELFCAPINGGTPVKEDLVAFLSDGTSFSELADKYAFDACLVFDAEAEDFGDEIEDAGFERAYEGAGIVAYCRRD